MYYILSFYLMLSSMMMMIISLTFMSYNLKIITVWNMMIFYTNKLNFVILLEWMNLMFMSVVLLISSMVLLYSMEYMSLEIYIKRFMNMIIIFFLSMMMMILSPNMFSILLGWDGLGLSSYCLIIYYQSKKSYSSGMVTILMNRIGDINILIMISMLLNKNSLNFMFLNKINMMMMMIIILVTITKSAQIPFSSWLPMAMAAPTPVSSLVHSSTLVTAGVYMMIRFFYLMNKNSLIYLMIISLTTMIMASLSALFEYDLKKIIALSTLSQLSLMFMSISLTLTMYSFFHLISHAMFKSLLFLCSGMMIHNSTNIQDIRMISFIDKSMPLTNSIFNIASITLSGMPFLSGFYSKDLIIEMFNMNPMNFFSYYSMYMCMMLTLLYSIRLIFFLSIKPLKIKFFNNKNIKNLMNYSIYPLFIMTTCYGSMMNWIIYNSINLVILPKNLKLLIFKLLLLTLLLFILTLKMTMKNFKLMLFFNYLWFFNINLKKIKMLIYMNSMKMSLINNTWLEYAPTKKFYYMIKNNIMKKNLIINLSLMMILILNFIFIILMTT